MGLKFANDDARPFERDLKMMERRVRDLQPALLAFGQHMTTIPARAVRAQADPTTGAPWPVLSGLTAGNRRGSGTKALQDTGRLVQSWLAATPRVDGLTVTIQSNVAYARLHNEGGTIKPRAAKNLALPLSQKAALGAKRIGVRAYVDSVAKKTGKKPFVLTSKAGNKFLVVGNRAGGLDFLFLLKKSVTIPARRYAGMGDKDLQLLRSILRAHLLGKG